MNYIDIELLSSKIKEIEDEFKIGNYYLDNSEQAVGYVNALSDFTNIVDSLQQEQPEVDLENYISNKLRELGADLINHKPYSFNRGLNVGKTKAYEDILGRLNTRKEE